MPHRARTVLVLGASGYVGGRLVPELIDIGMKPRCMTRSPARLSGVAWADGVDIVAGDLLDPDSLQDAFDGVDQVVYLVHSLGDDDFEERERRSAAAARAAADRAGVEHIVYLSGLGDDSEGLSPHLRSRHAVGEELASGGVSVTELRAAVILGAGSASFEMLRELVEVLPVMIAPTWVTRTRVQPVAIGDVITYLIAALEHGADGAEHHRIVQIGGRQQLTYRELMDVYAQVAGLRRRVVIPVGFVTPSLSTHWVNIVTPLPHNLSRSLIGSLRHDVLVTDDSARRLSDHEPTDPATAIENSIAAIDGLDIPTRWSGFSARMQAAGSRPWDPEWSGGKIFEHRRSIMTVVPPGQVMAEVRSIGGERGWYGFGVLWSARGLLDSLVGGVGLRRGRRHPAQIAVGEALDFWRVTEVDDDLFRLRAEMRLPGEAWLEWAVTSDAGDTTVTQRARYVPRGLGGRVYWWTMFPFHAMVFPLMLRRIVAAAARRGDGFGDRGDGYPDHAIDLAPSSEPPRSLDHTAQEDIIMSGEADQAKGRLKQAAGDLTDDDEMKREGEVDEASGKVKEKFDDAVDSVKDTFK